MTAEVLAKPQDHRAPGSRTVNALWVIMLLGVATIVLAYTLRSDPIRLIGLALITLTLPVILVAPIVILWHTVRFTEDRRSLRRLQRSALVGSCLLTFIALFFLTLPWGFLILNVVKAGFWLPPIVGFAVLYRTRKEVALAPRPEGDMKHQILNALAFLFGLVFIVLLYAVSGVGGH
jgi:hypothetical protein